MLADRWATVVVVLLDGLRLGWKVLRGGDANSMVMTLNNRYFAGHRPDACTFADARFDDPEAFRKAEAWAATFPAHPDEQGGAPVPATTRKDSDAR